MNRSLGWLFFLIAANMLSACSSELLEKQAEQIKQQQLEISRQRSELDALLAGQKVQEQKQQDCNRAFRDYFEKAQAASDRDQAIVLYREGLTLCPEDDVAHYELGRALVDRGRYAEARTAFETTLKINPGFVEAKRQLDAIHKNH
jgi:tetratricopeptide (TPR) repeat protein